MGHARKHLISLQDTPYYHVISRCVRHAWLWGQDEFAGRDYSHRKHWVIDRLAQLAEVFAIEICAYAVMSNHYHLVLYVDREKGESKGDRTIFEGWLRKLATKNRSVPIQLARIHCLAEWAHLLMPRAGE
jgi:hypothetical protein